jgi:biotin carboxyl carrier protein
MNFTFWFDNKEHKLNLIEKGKNDIHISLNQKRYHVSVEFLASDEALLNVNGKIYDIIIDSNSLSYSIYVNGKFFKIEKKSASRALASKGGKPKKRDIKTSMPGRIVKVLVKEGETVNEGQAVLVLEAMKMQNEIKSPQSGTITLLSLKSGDSVEAGTLLYSVE